MASRQIKMPAKDDSEKEVDEVLSQRVRPERGRYLLQVDRQTKGSYTTLEAAQSAALAIKTGYPIVQVSVYDSVEYTHTMVEVPAASSWRMPFLSLIAGALFISGPRRRSDMRERGSDAPMSIDDRCSGT
jgi:hypothetical protein